MAEPESSETLQQFSGTGSQADHLSAPDCSWIEAVIFDLEPLYREKARERQ